MVNEDTRLRFVKRSRIIQAIREFFIAKRYLEVETPMMHPIPGGASARPFVTHHNALDMQLYLRIAPELYLKRLVVGGFEKVFEINRNFRNEGMSTRHNPEFTMLEFYCAHRDYTYLMTNIEKMIRVVAFNALGVTTITYQGREIDLMKPYARMTITEAIKKYHPEISDEMLASRDAMVAKLNELKIAIRPHDGIYALQLTLFENTVESQLFDPTFIYHYPAEVSPLARRDDEHPEFTERFELYVAGRELANGFSELNDPEDQAQRFLDQAKQKDAGDQEAMHYDADYIRALEYGLPPTAGAGIGIDRLVMLYTDSASIRDVILFPQMRPE
jgi:lysyl-tRNA synthetase class 2